MARSDSEVSTFLSNISSFTGHELLDEYFEFVHNENESIKTGCKGRK